MQQPKTKALILMIVEQETTYIQFYKEKCVPYPANARFETIIF